MRSKRCEYCGHLVDSPSDNRDMAEDVVGHGKKIIEFLLAECFSMGDICNFCYAHVSMFKHEQPGVYEGLKQRSKRVVIKLESSNTKE